jgi:hypothetical protein
MTIFFSAGWPWLFTGHQRRGETCLSSPEEIYRYLSAAAVFPRETLLIAEKAWTKCDEIQVLPQRDSIYREVKV